MGRSRWARVGQEEHREVWHGKDVANRAGIGGGMEKYEGNMVIRWCGMRVGRWHMEKEAVYIAHYTPASPHFRINGYVGHRWTLKMAIFISVEFIWFTTTSRG